MARSRTVFPGSLVDGLLSDLAAEQRAAPELAGQLELDDLRWNLDRLASDNSADANVAAAVSAAVDRAAALQALHGCSDDTLETMLECGPPQRQNQALLRPGSQEGREPPQVVLRAWPSPQGKPLGQAGPPLAAPTRGDTAAAAAAAVDRAGRAAVALESCSGKHT